ncbi:MAG: OmpA family protein [Bdellovibrionaceae bacterium]|nr:OmpA family protein [Bdellovibrionales bacterium]MCB9084283.1 OmpA family protein [Pseudobdellovibrionaceae bacterium]
MRSIGQRKESGSWQIIYMDLMTMIMVFFVILWSINQGKDVGISDTIGDQTANMVNLPGDVLFNPGKHNITQRGSEIFKELFSSNGESVLTFETNALTKRMLIIHGHTDADGKKSENIDLGYNRAVAAYNEIRKHSENIPDHVIICTHADNSPAQEVPKFEGKITTAQRDALRAAKARNRRITIEDKVLDRLK